METQEKILGSRQKIWQSTLMSYVIFIVPIQTNHVVVKIDLVPLLLLNMLKMQHYYNELGERDHKGGGNVIALL